MFYAAGQGSEPEANHKLGNRNEQEQAQWRRKETLSNKPHKYKSTVINVIFGVLYFRRQSVG